MVARAGDSARRAGALAPGARRAACSSGPGAPPGAPAHRRGGGGAGWLERLLAPPWLILLDDVHWPTAALECLSSLRATGPGAVASVLRPGRAWCGAPCHRPSTRVERSVAPSDARAGRRWLLTPPGAARRLVRRPAQSVLPRIWPPHGLVAAGRRLPEAGELVIHAFSTGCAGGAPLPRRVGGGALFSTGGARECRRRARLGDDRLGALPTRSAPDRGALVPRPEPGPGPGVPATALLFTHTSSATVVRPDRQRKNCGAPHRAAAHWRRAAPACDRIQRRPRAGPPNAAATGPARARSTARR